MTKKVNPEERIVRYFNEAPIQEASVVFNIVTGIMKGRKQAELDDQIAPTPRKRRKKVKKATAAGDTGNTDTGDSSDE